MLCKRGLIIALVVMFFPINTIFASDSEDFVVCQQIDASGQFRAMKEKKNCFRDLARQRESELSEVITSLSRLSASSIRAINELRTRAQVDLASIELRKEELDLLLAISQRYSNQYPEP